MSQQADDVRRKMRTLDAGFDALRVIIAATLTDESHDLDQGMSALTESRACLMRAATGLMGKPDQRPPSTE